MAQVLNETFTSGIPGGFDTTLTTNGTLSVTYNAAQQAVDLSKDAFNSVWHILAVPISTPMRVVLDIEHTAVDNGNGTSSGFGFALRYAADSIWRSVLASVEVGSLFRFRGSAGDPVGSSVTEGVSAPYSGQGSRHTYEFSMSVASAQFPGLRRFTLSRGSERIYEGVLEGSTTASINGFGLFLRDAAIRLHSIQVFDDADGLAFPQWSFIQAQQPNRVIQAAPIATNYKSTLAASFAYDARDGGRGRIVGTVKEKAAPANLPLRRRVRLFQEFSGRFVGETWSDAVTGNYAFNGIDASLRYTVVTYDHINNYRAVIADNLLPEPM